MTRAVRSFFPPIPVAIPAGVVDPDEKLLAAWAGRPNPIIDGVPTVRAARRRLIALRDGLGIDPRRGV